MAKFKHKDIAILAEVLMGQNRKEAHYLMMDLIHLQQQSSIRKTLGAELQQYKPTEEQKAESLKNMANTRETVELPRQIEMPPLEINRSKPSFLSFLWDTLESILPK